VFKSRTVRWTGHVAHTGGEQICIQDFVGKLEGKGPFGRPRNGWEVNIKMNLKEMGEGAWTRMVWLRIGQVMHFHEQGSETLGSIKCRNFVTI
jgi:hypothetical protein